MNWLARRSAVCRRPLHGPAADGWPALRRESAAALADASLPAALLFRRQPDRPLNLIDRVVSADLPHQFDEAL